MSRRALIVGAGPAGLSAALHLAQWCDSTEVVEARPHSALRHTGEHLPPAGLAALTRLGFGPLLDDPRHQSSSGVSSAWGSEVPAGKEYFFTPSGCGRNLRREVFDAALIRAAEAQGVRIAFGTRLAALAKRADRFEATLRQGALAQMRDFDVVIDATGRNARAARLLGAQVRRVDDLVGISARIEACRRSDDAGRLYIEAVEGGWWYGVQFDTGTLLCTFMTDAARLSAHPGGAGGLWRDSLGQSRMLAPLAITGTPCPDLQVFDAATQSVSAPRADGFLAVGDAACAYDPLSSWGITKGMMDGHHGAEALRQHLRGHSDALARHRADRRAQYHSYHHQRTALYRAEHRWPQSQFWQARHRARAVA